MSKNKVDKKKEIKLVPTWKTWAYLSFLVLAVAVAIIIPEYYQTQKYIADRNYEASLTPQEREDNRMREIATKMAEDVEAKRARMLAEADIQNANNKWIVGLFAAPINTFILISIAFISGLSLGNRRRWL